MAEDAGNGLETVGVVTLAVGDDSVYAGVVLVLDVTVKKVELGGEMLLPTLAGLGDRPDARLDKVVTVALD